MNILDAESVAGGMKGLLGLLLLVFPLSAQILPSLPPSDRVLSREEVKNFWIHHLRRSPLPPRGNGLHPEKQQRHAAAKEAILRQIARIHLGHFDIQARLAQLEHNVEAHERRGETDLAETTEIRLFRLREHLLNLARLEAEIELARKLDDHLDRIDALESQIDTLRQQIQTDCH